MKLSLYYMKAHLQNSDSICRVLNQSIAKIYSFYLVCSVTKTKFKSARKNVNMKRKKKPFVEKK